jgi:hypothetical protein
MTDYRALISIPIRADNDELALEEAYARANSLRDAGVIIGHVELVTEIGPESLMAPARVVALDPGLRRQLPLEQIQRGDYA